MTKKICTIAVMAGVGLLSAGCENDDSPMQSGNSTITVVNNAELSVHVEYETQTWDALWPAIDVSHPASIDLAPGASRELSVHFHNKLGTSRIAVTKNGVEHNYDVGFGTQTLRIRESDFAANPDLQPAA